MTLRQSLLNAMLFTLCAVSGCKLFESTCAENDRTCLGGGELRSGQACIRNGDCAVGLACVKNICTYQSSSRMGDSCVTSKECAGNLYCSAIDLQCRPLIENPKGEGELCGSAAECQHGLVCDLKLAELFDQGPFSQIPPQCLEKQNVDDTPDECKLPRRCMARGSVDLGSVCKTSDDCLAGLFCIPNPLDTTENICYGGMKLPVEPVSVPLWAGITCPADTKTPTAYFEVPRKGVKGNDFYRLPFPNDIRRTDTGIDLSAHPGPPADLDPQAARRFLEAAGTLDGFATNPMVLFRFSTKIRNQDRTPDTLMLIDITKGSKDYGQKASVGWLSPEARSNYICPQWLALHPLFDTPLRSKTTYAAIVTKDIRTAKNEAIARSPDFDAMLKGDRPSQPDLAEAWARYAPLREYLADEGAAIGADQLLNAAVFTTQDATGIIPKLRAAVERNGPAELADMVDCSKDKSPCEDSTGRGACRTSHDKFVEIHGHVKLPGFQKGTPPFAEPEDGGELALDGSGNPVVQTQPSVCFALSLPLTPAPENGYPLLLIAHGTGGSFNDQMRSNQLAEFAASVGGAVLAIDMPSHGSRRGNSNRPPQDLYFNFMNPKGARGNTLQGAADLIGLGLLAGETISAGDSPTGKEIKFDASRVMLYAHSQGASHAGLMIGSEPRIRAAVLTGVGGHFASSLLLKQKPVDIAAVLPFALFDPDITNDGRLAGGEVNPMLALLQSYFESSDPLNYARELILEPPASAKDGHDVFMVYGLFDSFTPEATQQNYAKAAGLYAVRSDLTEQFMELPSPTFNNVMVGSMRRTVALRTYRPSDGGIGGIVPDGHFVATLTTRGQADVRRFITLVLQGKTPEIGQ